MESEKWDQEVCEIELQRDNPCAKAKWWKSLGHGSPAAGCRSSCCTGAVHVMLTGADARAIAPRP